MSDPSLVNNLDEFKKVTKEHNRLKPIVEKSIIFINSKNQLSENLDLIENEKDTDLIMLAKEENDLLESQISDLEDELKILILPHDPTDDKNSIIEIRAGTGGDEAALFASDLYRMYSRFAERNSWDFSVLDSSSIGIGGLKEIIFSLKGDGAYGVMKYESGVHRVQRVPKTETSGRVHTSAATVAILPEAEDADINVVDADLKIDTYRASGAGGQHVNKTESAIRITHIPTGLL